MPTPVTITEITPGSTGWQTVDLTTYFGSDAGNVAGVILEFKCTATGYTVGARKTGSSDTTIATLRLSNGQIQQIPVGVDGSDQVDINVGSTTNVDVYILCYYLNSEAVFFDNWVDKSTTTMGAWEDVDISSNTGSDTATAGIFAFRNTSTTSSYSCGVRNNGSTMTTQAYSVLQGFTTVRNNYHIIGLTTEVCEQFISNTAVDLYLIGYLKAGHTAANFVDKSTINTAVWEDVDVSSGAPSGATSAYFYWDNATAGSTITQMLRENGSSRAIIGGAFYSPGTNWVKLDANKVCEQYISSINAILYLTGWGETAAATSTWIPKIIFIT